MSVKIFDDALTSVDKYTFASANDILANHKSVN
jgi:hypothetical protein